MRLNTPHQPPRASSADGRMGMLGSVPLWCKTGRDSRSPDISRTCLDHRPACFATSARRLGSEQISSYPIADLLSIWVRARTKRLNPCQDNTPILKRKYLDASRGFSGLSLYRCHFTTASHTGRSNTYTNRRDHSVSAGLRTPLPPRFRTWV